jgi:hypothetical protein
VLYPAELRGRGVAQQRLRCVKRTKAITLGLNAAAIESCRARAPCRQSLQASPNMMGCSLVKLEASVAQYPGLGIVVLAVSKSIRP